MPIYRCIICNFSTGLKGNFNQHTLTKKHKNNVKLYDKIGHIQNKKNYNEDIKMNPNESILNPNESITITTRAYCFYKLTHTGKLSMISKVV